MEAGSTICWNLRRLPQNGVIGNFTELAENPTLQESRLYFRDETDHSAVIDLLVSSGGFFALRDAASRNVSAFDRCAELALLLMMIVTLFLFSRHPRSSPSS